MRKFLLILFLITGFFDSQSFASLAPNLQSDQKNKTTITKINSNFIEVTRNNQVIYFRGNVILERGDLSFLADDMVVFYDKDKKKSNSGKNSNIKKIEAKHNVKIFNEEFVATGEFGFYDPKNNLFTLKQNVVLNKGTSTAKGDKFTYNTKTKKSQLIGKSIKKHYDHSGDDEDNRVILIIDDENVKKDSKNPKNLK